ncbi:hypothetical protein DEJ46_20300 [Streptomyces venezuelae]|uniref:Uncharacterized protein n=1 Tax=Streptomyces venezuelae TaxID=54571 RepID=A0A5P2AS99_STRVZ|nr:hypothetical protein DEJ46_20300 [Streptomyces venezuelae]
MRDMAVEARSSPAVFPAWCHGLSSAFRFASPPPGPAAGTPARVIAAGRPGAPGCPACPCPGGAVPPNSSSQVAFSAMFHPRGDRILLPRT